MFPQPPAGLVAVAERKLPAETSLAAPARAGQRQ